MTNTQTRATFDAEFTAGPGATRSVQRIRNDDRTTGRQFWDTDNSQASSYIDDMNTAGRHTEQRIFHDQDGNAGG